jgi:hypothetical protein
MTWGRFALTDLPETGMDADIISIARRQLKFATLELNSLIGATLKLQSMGENFDALVYSLWCRSFRVENGYDMCL